MATASKSTLSTTDGLQLHSKSWKVKKPKGVLLLVHGFGEHMDRYQHVAAFFNQKSFDFVAYDRRGHGISEGQRGHLPSLEQELVDLTLQLKKVQTQYPNLPIFLYGHSQGGNFALNYLLRKKPNVTGTIITSPWITLTTEPPKLLITIGKLLHKILPKVSNKAEVGELSRDPEVGKKYAADPLVHGNITLRAGNETIEAGKWLANYNKSIDTPLLLMHGTGDSVTNSKSSQAFYHNTNKSIDFKTWDGFYHELHNEPEQKEVLEYMYQWIINNK